MCTKCPLTKDRDQYKKNLMFGVLFVICYIQNVYPNRKLLVEVVDYDFVLTIKINKVLNKSNYH